MLNDPKRQGLVVCLAVLGWLLADYIDKRIESTEYSAEMARSEIEEAKIDMELEMQKANDKIEELENKMDAISYR